MADSDIAEGAGDRENAERRVRFGTESEEETPAVTWRTIRFIELFFAVSCMSSLMALFMMNPIYDDYTRFCEDLVKYLRSPETKQDNRHSFETRHFDYIDYEDDLSSMPDFGRKQEGTPDEATTKSGFSDHGKVLFRLSYAIILFTLTTTVLMVLVLDLVSRVLGEPINKLPMIFMLAVSEILCLIIMVLSLDMFLGAINGTILAVSALALGLSICFVTDIVYTSARGNG